VKGPVTRNSKEGGGEKNFWGRKGSVGGKGKEITTE